MALAGRGGFGPEINDVLGYHDSAATGFSVVATPAPAQGTYRLKATGTSADSVTAAVAQGDAMSLTYRWLTLREFRLDGTLNSGQEVIFLSWGEGSDLELFWVYVSGSTYNVRIKEGPAHGGATIGTSSTAYSTGADIAIRVEANGTRVKVWIDGTSEIDTAEARVPNDGQIFLRNTTPLAAGQDMYWRAGASWESASESDRPGTAVNVYGLNPNADGTTAEYGDESCLNDNAGAYTKWDDWLSGGAADDATTFNCGFSTNNETELSQLDTATVTDISNACMAMVRGRAAANTGSKTVDTYIRIEDASSNSLEEQNTNMASTSFLKFHAVFPTAPDGGAWTQGDVDALQAGVRTVSTNGAHDEWTALGVEIISVDNDAPVAVGTRPLVNPSSRLKPLVAGGLAVGA